jgi:hypothetical protein
MTSKSGLFGAMFSAFLISTASGDSTAESARTYDYNRLIGHWVGTIDDGDKYPQIYITVKPIDDTVRATVIVPITIFVPQRPSIVGARNDSSARMGPFRFTPGENTEELDGILRLGRNWQFPARLRRGDPEAKPPAGVLPEPERLGTPIWTLQTDGPIWGSPVLVDSSLYVASADSTIYCLNRKSGKIRWRFRTGGQLVSYLTLNAHRLYALSDDGFLYVLNADTGDVVWKFDTGGGTVVRGWPDDRQYDHAGSSATIDGDRILIGSADGHVFALDRQSGVEKWRFKTDGIVRLTVPFR